MCFLNVYTYIYIYGLSVSLNAELYTALNSLTPTRQRPEGSLSPTVAPLDLGVLALMALGIGFRVWGLGFGVWGLGFALRLRRFRRCSHLSLSCPRLADAPHELPLGIAGSGMVSG